MKRTEEIRPIIAKVLKEDLGDISVDKIISEYQTVPMLMAAQESDISRLVGKAKAKNLTTMMAFAKDIYTTTKTTKRISNPKQVYDLVRAELEFSNVEKLIILGVSTKHTFVFKECISIGTLDSTLAEPKDVFHAILRRGGIAAFILVHNHPTGDPQASRDDHEVYQRMVDAGNILGITCLDHLIVGHSKLYSCKEQTIHKF